MCASIWPDGGQYYVTVAEASSRSARLTTSVVPYDLTNLAPHHLTDLDVVNYVQMIISAESACIYRRNLSDISYAPPGRNLTNFRVLQRIREEVGEWFGE